MGWASGAEGRGMKTGNTMAGLNHHLPNHSALTEILTLRDKFEEDKKRMAALRATRRFQPY